MDKTVWMLIITLTLLFISGCETEPAEWHMINVNYGKNQGDAHLLINGKVITMIDAGYYQESEKMVIPYLEELGIKEIDHFFISHPHRDHYEGMEAIQNHDVKIKNVYFSMPPKDVIDCCYNSSHFLKFIHAAKDRGAKLHNISKGFEIKYSENSKIKVLHAHKKTKINKKNIDVNDMSLIMRWEIEGWRVLFAGDLNHNIGSHLITDKRMRADILKVPHHGASGIAPKLFFENVGAVFSMYPGPNWIYSGKRGNIATSYSTDKKLNHCVNGINGNVILKFDDNITLKSEKPSTYCKDGVLAISRN